jgi:hypothetical protein
MRRHGARQYPLLHRARARELEIEPVAASAKLAFEILARQVRLDTGEHLLGLDWFRDVVDGPSFSPDTLSATSPSAERKMTIVSDVATSALIDRHTSNPSARAS